MGKLEFLAALRRAMAGLPPELQARTLAYYEQRFVDAAGAGIDESALAQELGEPARIAMTLRASTHLSSFEQDGGVDKPRAPRTIASVLRLFFSSVGLAVFNLFMVVPAGVFGSLLAALYASGLAFYIGGIAITSSGLAGATELVLDGPFRHVVISDEGSVRDIERTRTRVTIDELGVNVTQEEVPPEDDGKGAGGILIVTDVDADSRTMQTLFGFSLVLGGIGMLLLGIVATRYTFIGIRRYVQMNIALLKGS
jgi:uncharacterized membrane protein